MSAAGQPNLFKNAINGVKSSFSNEKPGPKLPARSSKASEGSIFSRLKTNNTRKLPDSYAISKSYHKPNKDIEVGAWKRKKLEAQRHQPSVVSDRAQRDLKARFGNRLVLKKELGRSSTNIIDRITKGVRQRQLDPSSGEKWSHDLYDGPKSQREEQKQIPISKSRQTVAKSYKPLPVEEHDIPSKPEEKSENNLNKVLVRGLPADIKKDQVEDIFSRYGAVKKAQVEDGFAIVSFTKNEGALQAHYVTNHKKMLKINGSVIKVTMIEDDDNK